MTPTASGSASLPRCFRLPQTPEPFADLADPYQPSPRRLRVKRRTTSTSLSAPTQQFLASVAAADVPIPSIEEPEPDPLDDEPMHDTTYPVIPQLSDDVFEHMRVGYRFEPPKTPVPESAPCLSPRPYPDWTIESAVSSSESSPDCDDSRPSTSRSTQTSASVFSTRFSLAPDETSPAKLTAEPFPRLSSDMSADMSAAPSSSFQPKKTKPRKAPWTKAMNKHLWSTYMLYLQDPKVTPLRIPKHGIPPEGVCRRVAREAKRSWKGSKAQSRADATPAPETFIQWPHTNAATMAHLRELCRLRNGSQVRATRHVPNSPTSFGRTATRHWNRRVNSARSPSVFGNDMSVSLALSTADSMQPNGPLAQLTSSSPPEPLALESASQPQGLYDPDTSCRARGALPDAPSRLGSPFIARIYGPSSTEGLDSTKAIFGPEMVPPRQASSANPRRGLQSPVRMTHSRSKSAIHKPTPTKQRSRAATNDPRRCRRPSVSELWDGERPQLPTFTMPLAHLPTDQPRPPNTPAIQEDPAAGTLAPSIGPLDLGAFWRPRAQTTNQPMALDTSPRGQPIRLGSPFVARASLSFPNRFTTTGDKAEICRPFSTMQSADLSTCRNGADRLAYVDKRLREVHQGHRRRRSDSPY